MLGAPVVGSSPPLQPSATSTSAPTFESIRACEANLSHPGANATFPGVGKGDEIKVDGESYEALAVNPERVILKALRNRKRYHLETNREQRTKNLAARTGV